MMDKKAKSSGSLRRVFFKVLGASGSKALLSCLLKKRYGASHISFPVNASLVKGVLLILPDRHMEVLYQLPNVISLVSLFKNASVTLLCEQSVVHYFKMVPGLKFIEYLKEERDAFSRTFTSHIKDFRDCTDICFLLDRDPDFPLLYFAGSTGATVRVGYTGEGDYPFINMHVNPFTKYLPERNCSVARMFGATPKAIRWTVSRKTIDEINHLFKELKIPANERLIGIDALFFLRQFGVEWTEAFLERISDLERSLYLFVEEDPKNSELKWLKELIVPVIPDLSVFKNAALVNRSEVIITGNTLMYALAGLLNKPAIGFFREDEIETYCPQTATLRGIPFRKGSDQEMVDKAVGMISEL